MGKVDHKKSSKDSRRDRSKAPRNQSSSKITDSHSKSRTQDKKSVTPQKAQRSESKVVEQSARKFYTVKEDYLIYQTYKDGKSNNITVSDMSKHLASKLGRSEESVRDRIKRYLSKLNFSNSTESTGLEKASKNTPHYHIHFVNDKRGPPFKMIGNISPSDPLVHLKAASALKEKKQSPRKPSPAKVQIQKSVDKLSKSPKPEKKHTPVQSNLHKRTPPPTHTSKSNTPAKKMNSNDVSKESGSKPVESYSAGLFSKELNEKDLKSIVKNFLSGLDSKNPENIKKNAQVLAECVKSLSSSYGVDISDVMTYVAKNKNGVCVANLRAKLDRM